MLQPRRLLFALASFAVALCRFLEVDAGLLSMSLFHTDFPSGGKDLSIFIEAIPPSWNTAFTPGNCSDCSCPFTHPNALEPLVHCLFKKSNFTTPVKKDATFVFVPVYSNSLRAAGRRAELSAIVSDDAFTRWKGSRHIAVDAFMEPAARLDYLRFVDQHLVISTNLTIDFVRSNRWFNSRHILVPPVQKVEQYPLKRKNREILCLGASALLKEAADERGLRVIDNISDWASVIEDIAGANFTILYADTKFTPFLIYEIIRARSVPVLISGPFLPAYANTYINYSRISIRSENLTVAFDRISHFDSEGISAELAKSARHLMWPLDGVAEADNAAGILFDALNTRHRVIRPVLRRTFIGSDDYIP
jgi:hypothetical protein